MKFNCAYSKKNITLTIDPPFLYIVLNFQPISCYVTFIHFSFPIENYLKPGFQLIQASKVNVPHKKHSPSTWGHDFKSSDPKIVGQEGKPCQIGQWSYEICQFSCEFFSCKGSITWVFPKYSTQLIRIFMHSI